MLEEPDARRAPAARESRWPRLPKCAALIVTTASLLGLAACQRTSPPQSTAPQDAPLSDGAKADMARLSDSADGKDWPAYGRTYGEDHFSPLAEVNTDTVGKLALTSFLDLPPSPVATQPIAVDGIIYMSSGLSIVRAIDAVTGKQLWLYDPKVGDVAGTKMIPTWGMRGIGYWDGKVYTGTADGRLIAIDAKSGKPVWSTQTTEGDDGRYITGAPRILNGRIIIGHGGADTADIRGYVTAYDAETGKQLWRFFTVPGDPAKGFENKAMEMAAKTWAGQWWKYGGGGNAWNAFAYDPDTDTVYVGTGNGAPWNYHIRSAGKGDNLFLCSIIALDAKTGAYKWHYQVNPAETWDYNAAMDMHLADVTIDGKVHKALIQAPKNGFLYVLDRTTGKLLAANKIAKVTWAKGIDLKTGRPIENPGIRFDNGTKIEIWPSYTGAHAANPSSFDPRTGIAYVPVLERGATYSDAGIDPKTWKRTPGGVFDFGIKADFMEKIADPLHNTSWLVAMNAATGKQVWRIKTPKNIAGGLMTTAGNLVFQGTADGKFDAYDSRDGKLLWSFDAQAPVMAAPITYEVKGKQYVTVIAGMGTSASNILAVGGFNKDVPDYRDQPRRVLTFVIGGTAKLPPIAAPTPAAKDPDYKPDPAAEAAGAAIYNANCAGCHAAGGYSGGGAPKLVRSPVILSADAFKAVVHDGGLKENGMPQFGKLTDEQFADLRQYLRSSAHKLQLK